MLTLVRATALPMFRSSLPVITLLYILNMPSAGASVYAQGDSLRSVKDQPHPLSSEKWS